jgi:baculoviral IAP repeat-containing protein 2/3
MIEAGFFSCNVGDRVICIYCNTICQQWTPNSDDPCEVHKTLSPKCSYVIAMLTRAQTSAISIINETSTNVDPFLCHTIVYTAACNTNYIEIPKRYASFATWPSENLPSVDDLVRAGFFYTGTKTIVTCFYCNGSLQNWGSNDNPTIEHARWFPNCAYAKQLCGAELYRNIQESKRAQQGLLLFYSKKRKLDCAGQRWVSY